MLAYAKRTISRKYMRSFLKKEKTFTAETCDVNYVFQENKSSNQLLVIFSGFPANGKPPVYNYVLKFRNLKCNKLFILDNFGDDVRGSYYLGTNGDWYVIDAVTDLIEEIATKNNIEKKDITCTGSSKGAFAALYYGIRNNYGTVIAGEPQIFLGDYLTVPDNLSVYSSMIGEVNSDNTKVLNDFLINLVEDKNDFPEITIHCGEDGYHHKKHIIPFLKKLDSKKVDYKLDLGSYKDHGNVGVYYPPLVISHYNKQ